MFADEKCKVLVASEELGIGINLPNVQNIIHFGLPVSKNEFVQEIGRAGRANEAVNSYVFYLEPVPENVPPILIKRELEIPDIARLLNDISNDYSDCYRKLNSNIDSKEDLLGQIMEIYDDLNRNGRDINTRKYPLATVDMAKKYIYMLYVIGFIKEWYSYSTDENSGQIEIMMTLGNDCGLARVKKRCNRITMILLALTENKSLKRNEPQISRCNQDLCGLVLCEVPLPS